MANNNINWLGNKVVDSKSAHLPPRQAGSYQDPSMKSTITQNDTVIMPTPSTTPTPTTPTTTIPPAVTAPIMMQGPPPATQPGYMPAYLASNIGKNVRAEFVVGTGLFTDRTGRLIEVGANYFVLEDINSRTNVMCDLYSVKFVTILQS